MFLKHQFEWSVIRNRRQTKQPFVRDSVQNHMNTEDHKGLLKEAVMNTKRKTSKKEYKMILHVHKMKLIEKAGIRKILEEHIGHNIHEYLGMRKLNRFSVPQINEKLYELWVELLTSPLYFPDVVPNQFFYSAVHKIIVADTKT